MPTVRVGRVLVFSGLAALIALGGNVLVTVLSEPGGEGRWFVTPVVGVVVAMLTALVDAYAKAGDARGAPPPGGGQHPYGGVPPQVRRARGGTSLIVALVIAVVLVGAVGLALAAGVRYATEYVTGKEQGSERLARPAQGGAGGVSLKVESVVQTAHFTRVLVSARNNTGGSLRLPLYENCVLVGGGRSLKADAFRSSWSETLVPGGILQRDTIVFGGRLSDATTVATLSFSTVFGFGGPNALDVRRISLKRP